MDNLQGMFQVILG